METPTARVIGQLTDYLRGLTQRLDPGTGWYGEFLRRDPEGMRACLDGVAVPPWDVLESLLADLPGEPGGAAGEAQYAAGLRAAAVAAWDAMPGGARELRALLAATAGQRTALAEALRSLTARLGAAGDPAEAAALSRELAWTRDDAARAAARHADLTSRLAALPLPRSEPEWEPAPEPQSHPRADPHPESAPEPQPRADPDLEPQGEPLPESPPESGGSPQPQPLPESGASPQPQPPLAEWEPQGQSAHRPQPQADPQGKSGASPQERRPLGQWEPRAEPAHRSQPYPHAEPHLESPPESGASPQLRTPLVAREPAQQPQAAGVPARQEGRRRGGGARYAGPAAAPVPPGGLPGAVGAVPDLPVPAPRGARFARLAADRTRPEPTARQDAAPPGPPARQDATPPGSPAPQDAAPPGSPAPEDVTPPDFHEPAPGPSRAGRPVPGGTPEAGPRRGFAAGLLALRAQGRTGEAHALLCEAAAWPAAHLPALAAELGRAGLAADWATLLWEAASLPPDRLAAAAAALGDAGREADCDGLLRQGVARPAAEVAEAALALGGAGRDREAQALLGAFVRLRTAEEAAGLARRDPHWFAPRLLRAARALSAARHRDLAHALRVAGLPVA